MATETLGFEVELALPLEAAVARVTEALKGEGFGVLTRIDVHTTLREKIGAEFRPYAILGACNPPIAHRALEAELNVGLLLPCNVVVYEREDGGSTVAFKDPVTMMESTGNEGLAAMAGEVMQRLQRVRDQLAG